jgi:hypothetical protein
MIRSVSLPFFHSASTGLRSQLERRKALAALDFIYIDYKQQSPLDLVISPPALRRYESIFIHLLRLHRIQAVVRAIWTDVSKPNILATPSGRNTTPGHAQPLLLASDPPTQRSLHALAFEARNLVDSIVGFALTFGIERNHRDFRAALKEVEKTALAREQVVADGTEGETVNLRSLEALHIRFLDRIMQTLFLGKKQAPLLSLLQRGLFGTIMLLGRKTKEWRRKEGGAEWIPGVVRDEVRTMHQELRSQGAVLVSSIDLIRP